MWHAVELGIPRSTLGDDVPAMGLRISLDTNLGAERIRIMAEEDSGLSMGDDDTRKDAGSSDCSRNEEAELCSALANVALFCA